jgi:hypothetical protein
MERGESDKGGRVGRSERGSLLGSEEKREEKMEGKTYFVRDDVPVPGY